MASFDPVAKLQAKRLVAQLSANKVAVKGDPLEGVRDTGKIDEDDRKEVDVVTKMIKQADKNKDSVSGDESYTTIVFLNKQQRDAFLDAMKWVCIEGGRYVDGLALASQHGVTLPPTRPKAIRPAKPDKKALSCGIVE
jgi:hypothetical protein